jgi:hypothetical protein
LQSAASAASAPNAEAAKLSADIANVNQLIATMQTVTVPSGVNWPLVVNAVAQYDPTTIELGSLTQIENKVQLTGRAINNDAVVRYQQNLFVTGAFKDVVVLSMSTVPPTPTPAATPAPDDAATTTATPEAGPFGTVEFVIDLVMGATTP